MNLCKHSPTHDVCFSLTLPSYYPQGNTLPPLQGGPSPISAHVVPGAEDMLRLMCVSLGCSGNLPFQCIAAMVYGDRSDLQVGGYNSLSITVCGWKIVS